MNRNSFFSKSDTGLLSIYPNRRYSYIKNATIRNMMLIYTPRTLAITILDRAKKEKNEGTIIEIEQMLVGSAELSKYVYDIIIEMNNNILDYAKIRRSL